jgi:hypothetical protein
MSEYDDDDDDDSLVASLVASLKSANAVYSKTVSDIENKICELKAQVNELISTRSFNEILRMVLLNSIHDPLECLHNQLSNIEAEYNETYHYILEETHERFIPDSDQSTFVIFLTSFEPIISRQKCVIRDLFVQIRALKEQIDEQVEQLERSRPGQWGVSV